MTWTGPIPRPARRRPDRAAADSRGARRQIRPWEPRVVRSPVVTPEQRIAALEAHLSELSEMIADARRRPGLELSDDEKRRLDEQAKRVGDAARYFLMGP